MESIRLFLELKCFESKNCLYENDFAAMLVLSLSVSPGSQQRHCVLALDPGAFKRNASELVNAVRHNVRAHNGILYSIHKRGAAMFILTPIIS